MYLGHVLHGILFFVLTAVAHTSTPHSGKQYTIENNDGCSGRVYHASLQSCLPSPPRTNSAHTSICRCGRT